MSGGNEDSQTWAPRPQPTELLAERADAIRPKYGPSPDPEDDNVLLDVHEDRWEWRRKIRRNPTQLVVYRCVIAVVGLLLVVLGFVSGPIPGPGGIPLVLLGLAIWSSEFEWAHRLMQWFKAQLHRFQRWTRPQQVLFWLVFFTGFGLTGYLYMLTLGIPGWVPSAADNLLQRLPGLT
jgi:uncharacterized protein (TIGR02611 family)